MLTFYAHYDSDIFSTLEEEEDLVKYVNTTFNLPMPDALEIKLSFSAIKKIQNLYSMLIDNNILTMEFYIFSKHENELNSFTPMHKGLTFDSVDYLDFDDVFFKTFKTNGVRVRLDKFYDKITFFFLYNNSWTEKSFSFSMPVKKILQL